MMTRFSAFLAFGILASGAAALQAAGPRGELVTSTITAHSQFQAGKSHYREGRYAEAIESFNRAIELAPDRPAVFIHRAHASIRLKRHADALADYNAYLERRPADVNVLWGRAQANNGVREYRAAIADADAALALKPKTAGAFYHRAYALYKTGDRQAALRDAEAGHSIDPDDECLKGLIAELRRPPAPEECEALIAEARPESPLALLKALGRG